MTNTPILNLPKITGNMSADVVRDMNALADAVDAGAAKATDLSTLSQTVAVHSADDVIHITAEERAKWNNAEKAKDLEIMYWMGAI